MSCNQFLDPDQARPNIGSDLGPNCLQRNSWNVHAQHLVRIEAAYTFFSRRQPCFWCMGSKNICEITLKRKLIWAFAVRICDKYLNLWLIYIEMWNVILGPQNISKPVVPIFKWQSIKLWKFTSSSTVWILKCSLNHNAIVCLRPPKPYSSWKIIIKW